MADFQVRSDAVDVEQIMRQIRARIREKRGVDYTEQEIRTLATAKLETFLDPSGVRSDLLEHFRRAQETKVEEPLNYEFEDTTLFESHRPLVRAIRRLLQPFLKLFFNYTTLSHVLHLQARVNAQLHAQLGRRRMLDEMYYEVIHNLVVEATRLGIEVRNLKMRVESMSSRLDFDERRARALEGVVQYRPGVLGATPAPAAAPQPSVAAPAESPAVGAGERRARRRRRRGRRRGMGAPGATSAPGAAGAQGGAPSAPEAPKAPGAPAAPIAPVAPEGESSGQ
jgi:hypothetical protein